MRSFLASRAPSGFGPLEAMRSERLIADAWRHFGILVVRADDPNLTWPERELVTALGNKRHGKRADRRAA